MVGSEASGWRELPEVIWTGTDPGWAAMASFERPVFLRPQVGPYVRTALARAVARPIATLRVVLAGVSPRLVLSFLVWADTAAVFGVRRVVTTTGDLSKLNPLLPRRRAPATAGPRPAIAGVVITQDDEVRLRAALTSLAAFVDEIVVVDGGSHDGSVAVAESFGATVVHRPFDRDFAAQKNAGLERVTAPWVVSLDTDEVVPPELADLIRELVRRTGVDAISTEHLNLIDEMGDTPIAWPDVHLRVFRSHLRYASPVHERLVGVRRIVDVPISGPYILHRKSRLQQQRAWRLYTEIDPTWPVPGELTAED